MAAGPVPIVFSENPAVTNKAMKASPEIAHAVCQIFHGRLLNVEELTLELAKEFLKEPREGRSCKPFYRHPYKMEDVSPPKRQ